MTSIVTFVLIFAVLAGGYILIQWRQRVDWGEGARRTGLSEHGAGDAGSGMSGRRAEIGIEVTESVRRSEFGLPVGAQRVVAFSLSFDSVGPEFEVRGKSDAARLVETVKAGAAAAGSERLEELAVIEADDATAAERFLDSRRRAAMIPFFLRDRDAVVTNTSIKWSRQRSADSTDSVVTAVESLLDLALILRASDDAEPDTVG